VAQARAAARAPLLLRVVRAQARQVERVRLRRHRAGVAVDQRELAIAERGERVRALHHHGQLEAARHDRGVPVRAAAVQHDGHQALFVRVRELGGGEALRHEDRGAAARRARRGVAAAKRRVHARQHLFEVLAPALEVGILDLGK
jgi:hypothetical protein